MNELTIKNCIFGNGIPKICIPIMGRNEDEIMNHCENIKAEMQRVKAMYPDYTGSLLDVIEFRGDYFEHVTNNLLLVEILMKIRACFKDELILFTYRSEEEGGELRHDRAENMLDDIYDWVLNSGQVDMIDVEILGGDRRVKRVAAKAKDKGVFVVMSNHDFNHTPHDNDILERFTRMQFFGADILKGAYMPRNEFDVRRLMELTEDITKGKYTKQFHKPVITMSMGKLGKISRVTGEQTGSAMTFVCIGKDSAPGQYNLEEYVKYQLEQKGSNQ